METLFDHERLDVYRLGRELNQELAGIISELPRGAGEAADNLRRGGASITRNLAEANGRKGAGDRSQRFHMARASGMEVGASLDELVDFRFVAPTRVVRAKSLASRIVAMTTGLIRSIENGRIQPFTPQPDEPEDEVRRTRPVDEGRPVPEARAAQAASEAQAVSEAQAASEAQAVSEAQAASGAPAVSGARAVPEAGRAPAARRDS